MESKTWTRQIAECFEDESKRFLLKCIPSKVIYTLEYTPDWIYWLEYGMLNRN